MISTRIWNCFL